MYVPCIHVNPMVVVENLTTDGIIKRKARGKVVLSKQDLSFSLVEPNHLGHRTRVSVGMSPKEPAYGIHQRCWGPTK